MPQVTDPLTLEAIPTMGWPVSALSPQDVKGDSLSHPQLPFLHIPLALGFVNFYFHPFGGHEINLIIFM